MANKSQTVLTGVLVAAVFAVAITGSYAVWNHSDPANTCARCHEIGPSHEKWLTSAHANVKCVDCHGKALSSMHSFKEKAGMVFRHFTAPHSGKAIGNEDIRMSERQILDISARCAECHRSEHAQWAAGGHSATYGEIFEDPVHNAAERPYEDCFRCHGMYYDRGLNDLMDLSGSVSGNWKIHDRRQAAKPAMPCLACHEAHTQNPVSTRSELLATPRKVHFERPERNPRTALYLRSEKTSLRSDRLTPVRMKEGNRAVKLSEDATTLLCMQCHSPNTAHQAGSMDDRTPTGVHEGLSCTACHKGHSLDTRNSCKDCHPALSNCGLDVAKMNTTFLDPASPHDIHRVSCTDCHGQKI